jgi:hypothetical protein
MRGRSGRSSAILREADIITGAEPTAFYRNWGPETGLSATSNEAAENGTADRSKKGDVAALSTYPVLKPNSSRKRYNGVSREVFKSICKKARVVAFNHLD